MKASPSKAQDLNTPIELLKRQTELLEEIHRELMRRKQVDQRKILKKRILVISKWVLIGGSILYFAWSVQQMIAGIQRLVPKVPEMNLPEWNPEQWGKDVSSLIQGESTRGDGL